MHICVVYVCLYMHKHMIFLLEIIYFCSGFFQVILSFSPEVSISLLRYPIPLGGAHLFYSGITFIIAFKVLGILNPLNSVSICWFCLTVCHDYIRRNTSSQFWFKIQLHGYYEACIPDNVILVWKTLLALICSVIPHWYSYI